MSREIKFRAWDKLDGRFRKILKAYFTIQGKVYKVALFDEAGPPLIRYIDDIELMQYTGIKDKRRIEIYEGDVIQYKGMFVIEWDQYFCRFHRKSLTIKSNGICQVFPLCEIEEKEVIGNIHENPELLK